MRHGILTTNLLAIALALLSPAIAAGREGSVSIGPAPSWITTNRADLSPPPAGSNFPSGAYLLLTDVQENTRLQQIYWRQAISILNPTGVESFSDVTVDYQPAYQSLCFHVLRLHRHGRVIDKLSDHEIRTYQREEFMDAGIYDGRITAVVNLSDVRPGDVLEYAYTVSGSNPLLRGRLFTEYVQRTAIPRRDYRVRVIVDPHLAIHVDLLRGAEPPQTVDGSQGREYVWTGRGLPALVNDPVLPPWLDPEPMLVLSSWQGWADVVAWAEPLYRLSAGDLAELASSADSVLVGENRDQRVLSAINFVQDQIRYLAREDGLWAYKPRKPAVCMRQRFGDCKDKSLLLVGLLRLLDVEAYPLLVSSSDRSHVAGLPPSPHAFDHCVVGMRIEGEPFYVDPTWSHQGGDVSTRWFGNFGRGLPVRAGVDSLENLPLPSPPLTEIETDLVLAATGSDSASFRVTTRFHGSAADYERGYLAGQDHDQAARQYESFYSKLYPGIRTNAPLEVDDEDRFGENVLTVVESYTVEHPWQPTEGDTTRLRLLVDPIEMKNYLEMAPSPARSAPYWAGGPIDFRYHATVRFPETRDVMLDPVRIAGPGYVYESSTRTEGGLVHCRFQYRREVEDVPAAEASAFLGAHQRMRNDLGVYINKSVPYRTARGAVVFAAGVLLLSVGLAWRFGWRYDPPPRNPLAAPRPIAGWLVLPAIGVAMAPVTLLVSVFKDSGSLFNAQVWSLADQGTIPIAPVLLKALFGAELLLNVQLAVWSIMLAVLFFRRRSSTPRLYVLITPAAALCRTLDLVIVGMIPGLGTESGDWSRLGGTWIAVCVWVPYFLTSQRVRETFTARVRPTEVAAESAAPPSTPLLMD